MVMMARIGNIKLQSADTRLFRQPLSTLCELERKTKIVASVPLIKQLTATLSFCTKRGLVRNKYTIRKHRVMKCVSLLLRVADSTPLVKVTTKRLLQSAAQTIL